MTDSGLGRTDRQRRSSVNVSHAAHFTTSPFTLPETRSPEELFQQPPPSSSHDSFYPSEHVSLSYSGSIRHSWLSQQQNVYGYNEQELSPRTRYYFDSEVDPEVARTVEDPSRHSRSENLHWDTSQIGSASFSELKREETEQFIPLSRHSRTLSGTLVQPSNYMSTDYYHSSGYQEHPTLPQLTADAPIASSSRAPNTSTSRHRNPPTTYSDFPVSDVSPGATDPAGHGGHTFLYLRNTLDHETSQAAGELLDNDESSGVGPIRSKKQRTAKGRDRPRIELAKDQPPTTQGKQRERVYVACQQCRSRKIRCDGAKPMCFNCNQRGTGICEFDPVPKRRGPDRQPGARQRHGKFPAPRTRRRTTKDEKAEMTPAYQESPEYPTPGSGSESTPAPSHRSDVQRTTWGNVPSPPSTGDRTFPSNQHTPGSSGSETSPRRNECKPLVQAPTFAYNFSQDGYLEHNIRQEADQRSSVPHISTDAMNNPPSAPVSAATFSPDTPGNHMYSFTNPFTAQTLPYSNAAPSFATETGRGSLDSMATLESTASPESAGFIDYVPRGLEPSQPAIVDDDPTIHVAYAELGALAPHHRGCVDYAPLVESCAPILDRQNGAAQLEHDAGGYNPYQWAVSGAQGVCSAYISVSEEEEPAASYEFSISHAPTLDFVRKTWWDSLLDTYCAELYCSPAVASYYRMAYGIPIVASRNAYEAASIRNQTSQIIIRDLQFLFKNSNFWFAFINVPLFFGTFFRARNTMQPALVLAILMFSNYLRSSMEELGVEGIERTLWLKEKAQAALDASVNAQWVDPGLGQAAWLIALFECSSQPKRNVIRSHSALATLDNVIRSLSLTFIDAENLSSSAIRSTNEAAGHISYILPMPLYSRKLIANSRLKPQYPSQLIQYRPPDAASGLQNNISPANGRPLTQTSPCMCNELKLGSNWDEAKEHVPFWLNSPSWKASWTDGEIKREECRRLCWNTLLMLAAYTTYRSSLGLNILDMFMLHPSNFRNIFPGENLVDLSTVPPSLAKTESVWALYARSILLWHACLRIHNVSDRERAVFAHSVWLEADAIENALDGHGCNIERAFLYQGREYLFNARMHVSNEFRRFVPHPSPDMSGAVHRRKTEEWLTHQATIAKRVMYGLQTVTGMPGNMLAKRPFFLSWFMAHVSRCLQLWNVDKSLTVALELAKNFLFPINYLCALWPCPDQRVLYAQILRDLENACREAGLAPPPYVDLTFPLPSRTSPTL